MRKRIFLLLVVGFSLLAFALSPMEEEKLEKMREYFKKSSSGSIPFLLAGEVRLQSGDFRSRIDACRRDDILSSDPKSSKYPLISKDYKAEKLEKMLTTLLDGDEMSWMNRTVDDLLNGFDQGGDKAKGNERELDARLNLIDLLTGAPIPANGQDQTVLGLLEPRNPQRGPFIDYLKRFSMFYNCENPQTKELNRKLLRMKKNGFSCSDVFLGAFDYWYGTCRKFKRRQELNKYQMEKFEEIEQWLKPIIDDLNDNNKQVR